MECLDANAVQDLMSDGLDAGARAQVMTHLDSCQDCRELVGVLAKDTIRESQNGAVTGLEATAMPTPIGLDETKLSGDPLGATAPGTDPFPKLSGIAVGRVLGRYTLVERLGSGAMGVVYRATDRELSRDVAVKILHRPDDALTERLVREARSMAQVNHPNVVAVYDVGLTDETTWIAMELVQGDSLRAWQAEKTVAEIIEAYVDAGRGLGAAHAAGIIHRDFKPDNVLVGKEGRVRVTDFGLAAARASDDAAASRASIAAIGDLALTREGTVMGTPAYMAPEQFDGGNVDARTDQFNFAVALYEALYKERPFAGKTFEELGANVCDGKIKPPPAKTRVSNALREILLRGMSVKPGDRYPTMDHMLDELARDRARPYRWASRISAGLAVILALFFAVDLSVRDRLTRKATQSFRALGKQTDRTLKLLTDMSYTRSSQAKLFSSMLDIGAYRVDEEFGLGGAEDPAILDELHQKLASTTWFNDDVFPSVIAVTDYKGRLFYTSAAPTEFAKTDVTQLPEIQQLSGKANTKAMRLVKLDDPAFVATRLVPNARGLGVLFASSGAGDSGFFLQIFGADQLFKQIELDDTQLSLVAPDGTYQGEVPGEIVARATANAVQEITIGTATYQVQAKPIVDERVGRIVMATRIDGLLSLFPHARTVFAAAMILAMLVAVGTYLRMRHLVQ